MPVTGNLVEVFSGIQGEGTHVGERHLFLRLAGCDRDCAYCDQPESRIVPLQAMIEISPGRREFMALPNPLGATTVSRAIRMLNGECPHCALAVTGGEPLLQAEFLRALLPAVRKTALPVLLETNGTRPDDLAALLRYVNIVSMDLKLKSATGRPMPRRLHERFLRTAVAAGVETVVKAVITKATTLREVRRAANLVASASADVPLVLQPVTPVRKRGGPRPPSPEMVLRLQEAAVAVLRDVRVIPQTHKMTGQR